MPSAVAETGHTGVRRRRRGRLDELSPRFETHFFVLLDVDVDGQNGHGLSHDERERAEVERPAVVVLVLLVLIPLVAGVSGVAGDVHDYADYVAQTCQTQFGFICSKIIHC